MGECNWRQVLSQVLELARGLEETADYITRAPVQAPIRPPYQAALDAKRIHSAGETGSNSEAAMPESTALNLDAARAVLERKVA